VNPERAGILETEDCVLGGFEINGIVSFEFLSKFEFEINGGTNVGRVIKHVEGFIGMSLSVVDILHELLLRVMLQRSHSRLEVLLKS